MSTKGYKHTAIAKFKIGIANQKDRAEIDKSVNEYIVALPKDKTPTLTDAAIHAHISEKNLILYETQTDEGSDIRLMLDLIRDMQKSFLIHGGLNKRLDSKITTLLLKVQHNLKEDNPNLSQTNIFNVSPDILADALNLSRTAAPAK